MSSYRVFFLYKLRLIKSVYKFVCFQFGMQFYYYFLENIKLCSNRVDNFEALFCTMSLIAIEMTNKETVVELIRLGLDMQVSVSLIVCMNEFSI